MHQSLSYRIAALHLPKNQTPPELIRKQEIVHPEKP